MQISLPDDLYAAYEAQAKTAKKDPRGYLIAQLQRHVDTPLTARHVTLTGDALEQVERLLGGGSILTPDQLLDRIRRWAGITLGDIRMDFTAAQLEEIVWRARKQGKTPGQICQDIVAQMSELFFNGPTVMR